MQINILSESEAATLRELIAASERIVICGHKSPDGDAIGSSLGWAAYLRSLGKSPDIVMPDAMPDFLHWLPNSEKVVRHDKRTAEVSRMLQQADLLFCLDFNDPGRVEDMQADVVASPARKVMIDHHLDPNFPDTALAVSHPEMSSTSEMVFRVVWQLGGFKGLDRQWAAPIYCGMMTDTGGFTYNSTNPEIYFIISQLLTKGIDKDKIYRNVFNNYSSWAVRLRGYMMCQKLNVFEDLHASYYAMTRTELRDFHFIRGDAEGLVNEPLRIKGLKLSISLREDTERDNLVLVSVRSVDDFPANEVAARFFNGGGHVNAAGGKLHCSISEAEQVARKAIRAFADRLKA